MNWIAVALTHDVPPGVVIPSRIEDTDLAIWCTSQGRYHAWSDRCPHRGMRLSHGFVRGDSLACIYHGWQYGEAGSCGYIPAHPNLTPPSTICVPNYPCVTSNGAVWVSLSDTDLPPPDIGRRAAVRTLSVDVSAPRLAQHFGGTSCAPVIVGTQNDVALALQPVSSDACMAHAFATPGADRRAVSRWLEALRAEIERDAT